MKIQHSVFGNFQDKDISLYELHNDNGMVVKIMNYGATITSITIPKKEDGRSELVCGFDTFENYFSEEYINNAPYFGCTVGRYASRIKDGQFKIDGKTYKLAINNAPNHLHGGIVGFDKKVWPARMTSTEDIVGVEMSLNSPHMDEGYPGNVSIKVNFLLNNRNELTINYEAETDQTTPISLTNHTYFNLSGFKETIGNHTATIEAKSFLTPDETNVPVGEVTMVDGTTADLRSGKVLEEAFEVLKTGFEHYYVFDKDENILGKVAEFKDNSSGRKLIISTSEPGALFYTGFYTSEELKRESGSQYGKFRAFCFETSRYPNGPNISNSPGSVTKPGEKFISTTVFKIKW